MELLYLIIYKIFLFPIDPNGTYPKHLAMISIYILICIQ